MTAIAICEKPSQARNVVKALGGQVQVLACQGHLFRLQEPQEANPAWAGPWSAQNYPLLWPGSMYRWCADDADGKPPRIRAIRDALKTASCVYIATDSDREGQVIGETPLRAFGYAGPVKRMIFNHETPAALQKAFREARGNAEFAALFACGNARHQADQIYGMSLTRAVSVAFGEPGSNRALGVGRVKTPMVRIAVDNALARRNFRKTVYYAIQTWATSTGPVTGSASGPRKVLLTFLPDQQSWITDPAIAARLAAAASGQSGPLHVSSEEKRRAPPHLPDQGALQKAAAAWGWTVEKTSKVMQYLYQEAHLLSYPGTDGCYLPDEEAGNVPGVLAGLASLGFGPIPTSPRIRTGKSGHFWSKGLEGKPHYAIVPYPDTFLGQSGTDFRSAYAGLDADQKRLFDHVASLYIAAVSEDYRFRSTTMSLDIELPFGSDGTDEPCRFSATGRVPIDQGWRAVRSDAARGGAAGGGDGETEDGADDDDEAGAVELPAFRDGEPVTTGEAGVRERATKPPGRLTEGALVDKMKYIWRDMPEGPERDRLEASEGFGRPRTRGPCVAEAKRQGWLVPAGRFIEPSEDAIRLIELFREKVPELIDYGLSGRLEMRLDAIEAGTATEEEVIAEFVALTDSILSKIKAIAGTLSFAAPRRSPTKPMIQAVNTIAKAKALKPSREVFTSFAACSAWLKEHSDKAGDGPRPPSQAALDLARKLAEGQQLQVPDDVLADAKRLGEWIEGAKKTQKPSDKAVAFAERLAREQGVSLTAADLATAPALSKAIKRLQQASGTTGGARPARRGAAPKQTARKKRNG